MGMSLDNLTSKEVVALSATTTDESTYTFWTELNETTFKEKWVHALPIGKWKHPVYGTVNHTIENIKRFADNVKNKVRGIDPYVNYDHREKDGRAAGWIKDADVRSDGLWLLVELNDDAAQAIQKKEYRYWSTEYRDEWEDPHTEKKYNDVIIGGALTNIPFLKNLVPINLSELGATPHKENKVDREKLIKALGLSEDATDEQIEAKLNEVTEASTKQVDLSQLKFEQDGKTVKVTHPDIENGETSFEITPVEADKDEDAEAELAALAEKNPAVKALMEDRKQMKESVKALETAHRLSEVTTKLDELGADQKKGLPPVAKDKLRTIMARLPRNLSDDIHGALVDLFKVGLVDLSETNVRKPDSQGGDDGDAVTAFMDIVDTVQKENKELSYSDAVTVAAQENPDEFKAYNEAIEEGYALVED